jgi:hypothetical protein
MSESRGHTKNEVRKEAPNLAAIPRDNFIVPEGYFSELEYNLKSKFQEGNSELQVPHDFFETMHTDILAKIASEDEVTRVVPLRNSKVAVWISTAVSIAAIGLLMFWFLGNQEGKCETFACLLEQTELSNDDLMILDEADLFELIGEEQDLLDAVQLDEDDLLNYLEDDIEDFTVDELYE